MQGKNQRMELSVVGILMMVSLAANLSLPGGYQLGASFFVVLGLVRLTQRLLARAPLREPTLAGKLPLFLVGFAIVGALVSFWHSEPSGHYELFIPFLWAPLIFLAVLDGQVDRRYVWIGCLFGAALACMIAVYQSIWIGVERPSGFLNSPIFFGNNALLLGSVALAGRHDPPFNLKRPVWLALGYAGFLLGMTASLVSLSKGGWPFALLVLTWVIIEDFRRSSKREWRSLVLIIIACAALLTLLPANRILDRINTASAGAIEWFRTGHIVEGSVAPRLELWKLGVMIWPEKPWLGHAREGVTKKIHEKAFLSAGYPGLVDIGALHSESIQLLAEKGLAGFLAWLLMYLSSAAVFWCAYVYSKGSVGMIGQAGLIILMGSFIFGLSDTHLIWNVNRQIFVFLVMSVAAILLVERGSSS
jgi:O-antigen ligase